MDGIAPLSNRHGYALRPWIASQDARHAYTYTRRTFSLNWTTGSWKQDGLVCELGALMTFSFSSSTGCVCAEATSSRKLTSAELKNDEKEGLFYGISSKIKAYRVRQKLAQSNRLL